MIAMRRALLVGQSALARESVAQSARRLRSDLAVAALGLVAGRVLIKRPWLGALAVGALALFTGSRLAARSAEPGSR